MKNIYNGNGIFINPLHNKIQYSAVRSPPPALISHCDQENYTLTYYIEFYDINSMGTINDDIKVKSNQIQLQATVIVRSTRTRTPTARIKWDYHKITSNDINSNNINSKINSNDNSNNNIRIKNIPNNDHTNSSINNITSNNNRNNYRSNNNITSNEKSNNRRIKNITGDNIINSSNNNITTNDKCNNKNINNSSSVLFVVVVDESVKRKANVSQ